MTIQRKNPLNSNRRTDRSRQTLGKAEFAPLRICFEFREGDAYNVAIVNYHKG